MTIVYDMASGTIQSETSREIAEPEQTTRTAPPSEPRLATVETGFTPPGHDNPQSAVHLIRRLLSSD